MNGHATLNKMFRLVWSSTRQAWVVVAENVRGRGKTGAGRAGRRAAAVSLSLAVGGVLAAAPPPPRGQLPTGASVAAGQARVGQSGGVMTVEQGSGRAVIDWATFDVGSAARVDFLQPSAAAAVLNRVHDSNPSQIFGRITAPGQVFFSNPNGLYFAPGAQVDVGALTATTHGIGNADFMEGKLSFSRDGATGTVRNDGAITAGLGGYIALLAPEVRNDGVLLARAGTVALASGEAVTLNFGANHMLTGLTVTPSQVAALVENRQAVHAPDGLILLSARAVDTLQGAVVLNSGVLEASSLHSVGGRIVLEGDKVGLLAGSLIDASGATGGGTVLAGGDYQGKGDTYTAGALVMDSDATIDVSATARGDGGKAILWSNGYTGFYGNIHARGAGQDGAGGFVETSSHDNLQAFGRVNAGAGINGRAGTWLLDPSDVTIVAGGNNLDADSARAGDSGTMWIPSATSAQIGVDNLNRELDNNSYVRVFTDSSFRSGTVVAGSGNIVLSAGADIYLSKKAVGDHYLELDAGGSIILNGAIHGVAGGNVGLILNAAGGSVSGSGAIDLGGQGALSIITGSGSGELSGAIQGVSRWVKEGDGTVVLSGANDYSGSMQISQGALAVKTMGNLDIGAVNVDKGAVLELNAVGSAATYVNMNYTGSGALRKTGPADVKLQYGSIASTPDGLIDVQEGTLYNLDGFGWGANYADMNVATGATYFSIDAWTQIDALSGNGRVVAGGAGKDFIVGVANGSGTFSGVLEDIPESYQTLPNGHLIYNRPFEINLSKVGSGTQVLTGTNVNHGTVTVSGGTLQVGAGGTSGQLGGDVVNNAHLVFDRSDAFVINNRISGSGDLVARSGDGLTLNGAVHQGGDILLVAGADETLASSAIANGAVQGGDVLLNNALSAGVGKTVTIYSGNATTGAYAAYISGADTSQNKAYATAAGGGTVDTGKALNAFYRVSPVVGIGGLKVIDKVYDGGTVAAVDQSGLVLSGLIDGDGSPVLTPLDARFSDRNVGADKTVVLSGALDGLRPGYQMAPWTDLRADITPAPLVARAVAGSSKVYDGGTALDVHLQLDGAIGGDDVAVNAGVGALMTKDVGSNKQYTLRGLQLSGADKGNYYLSGGDQLAGADAMVTPRQLNVRYQADAKIYDGTTVAQLDGADDRIAGDDLVVQLAGGFEDKNIGLAKRVLVRDVVLSGADASNYSATVVGEARANILARQVSVIGGVTVADKVYDGDDRAVVDTSGAQLAGLVDGEHVAFLSQGRFDDKNVGHDKAVTMVGGQLVGADAGNYVLSGRVVAQGDITPRTLAVSGVAARDKVYDGTAEALLDTSKMRWDGVVAGDDLTLLVDGRFRDKNVGTGKQVFVTPLLGGADAGNYLLADAAPALADITPRTLLLSGVRALDKVYDGGATAQLNTDAMRWDGAVEGDDLTLSADGRFLDKNVGTSKQVVISHALGGADAGNYIVVDAAAALADIAPRALAVSGVVARSKVYDGSVDAQLDIDAMRWNGALDGDDLTVSLDGRFVDKNVGSDKPVDIGLKLGGADAGNYVLSAVDDVRAAIAPRELLLAGAAATFKPFDGLDSLAGALDRHSGQPALGYDIGGELLEGDDVQLAGQPRYDDRAPGHRVIEQGSLTMVGGDADNYRLIWSDGGGEIESPQAEPQLHAYPLQIPVAVVAADAGAGAGVSVVVMRQPTVSRPGLAMVTVSAELVDAGAGYAFGLPEAIIAGGEALHVALSDGGALPGAIAYDDDGRNIRVAGGGRGVLPPSLMATAGTLRMVISFVKDDNRSAAL